MKKRFSTLIATVLCMGALVFFTSNVLAQGGTTCGAAVAIAPGAHTTGAINVGAGANTICSATSAPVNARWFTYTPAAAENITVSSCGGSGDTFINIYTGACGGLTCETFNDDACGLQSSVTFAGTAGTTYYIAWSDNYASVALGHSFSLSAAAPLDCSGDGPLTCSNAANSSAILFSEDWESGNAQGWTGAGAWTINTGGTGSGGTGPLLASCGNTYVYWETSGAVATPSMLNFPNSFNLNAASDASVDFFFHAVSTFAANQVDLEASTDGGASWTSIWSYNTGTSGSTPATQAEDFVHVSIDLAAFLGNTVTLRYIGLVDTGFDDIALDNIKVQGCIPCTDPALPVITSCPSVTNPISSGANICGAFVDLPDLLFTDGCPDAVITNDLNGTDNADGDYPVGTTVVTWTVTDVDGGTATCQTTITVIDDTAPAVNCPSDMFINLPPGGCSEIVSYAVTASDNCPFISPATTLSTLNAGGNGGAVGGGVHFDLTNLTPDPMIISELGLNITAGTQVEIFVIVGGTYVGNQLNAGAWTLMGTADATVGPFSGPFPGNGTITPAPVFNLAGAAGITLPAGTHGIALRTVSAASNYTNGNGTNQSYTDGSLQLDLGSAQNTLFTGFAFNPRVWNGSVSYQIGGDAVITQTSGLPSGSEYPIGVTTNCFEVTDVVGNVGTCCFDINVAEFSNPTSSLTCNDNVQISLDETCSATVGADDILEGGPYGCYDNYTVMVLSPVGGNLGDVVDGSFIGTTWTVKVIDPNTGNSCWGSINVEDKLDPTIECRNVIISCTADLPNEPAAAVTGPQAIIFENLNDPLDLPAGQNITQEYFFDYATIFPTGTPVQDVNVIINLDHAFTGDANVDVIAPDGTLRTAFALTGCQGNFPINCKFDDEGPAGVNCFDLDRNGDPLMPLNNPGVFVMVLDGLDGLEASGTWTVRIFDDFPGLDGGTIFTVGLEVTADLLQAIPFDNCGPVTVDFEESSNDDNCGGPSGTVIRTWTATDPSGNSSSCVQTITRERPTLNEVDVPKDIKWTCTQYNVYSNIIDPAHLHAFITDTDVATDIIDVNLNPFCDDDDFDSATRTSDSPFVNSTNTANGGNGCPGAVRTPKSNPGPNSGLDDADVLELTGSGVPTVEGLPLDAICEIATDYEDIWITICEGANGETGTFKIVRQWTLIDWCANPVDVRQINQVIKVVDELAPNISVPATTLNNPHNVDVYNSNSTGNAHTICEGSVIIPAVSSATDNCSGVASYTTEIWTVDSNGDAVFQLGTVSSNTGIFNNIPLFENGLPARYIIRYYASDYCDNQDFRDLYVRLRDRVPPVVVCDEITEVSITNNGNATGESCSNLRAEDLDDGSYDNCTPVYFLMAKMDDANVGAGIFNRCYYPTRDFCCDDLGDNTVILLVLDQDPTPFFNTTIGTASLGCDEPTPSTPSLFLSPAFSQINYNTCMITVQVTDKLAPVNLSCPPNQRVTCDWWANNIETDLVDDQGNEIADEDQCDVLSNYFGTATYFDNCDAIITCSINNGLDQCLEGRYVRTWSAIDAAGNFNSSQNCRQTIWVDHVSDWSVEFPADIVAECGEDQPDFGEPIIFKETCELVAVSYEDELFTDEPGVCYKVLRTWTVINWCVVGDDIDQEVVEISEAELWNQGVTNLLDRDINMDGFFSPQEANSNRSYRTFRDSWNNAPGRIHKPTAALNPTGNQSHNTNITDPDTDTDSDPWDGYIIYQQVIKVNDTVDPIFTNGCQIDDICIGDNTCSATVVLPSPDITECSANVNLSVQIQIGGAWLNGFGPYLNIAPGTYNVRYVAMDNCNNQTACETTVTVVDCKKPTPYCKNGLVVELMVPVNPGDEPMVEVWASDLNDASFDNCPGDLKFSFSSDVNDIGNTYFCDDLGQNSVEVWVTDAAGNQDFCITSINIQANMGQCNDDPLIAGAAATEMGEGVENVNVNINSPSGFDESMTTDFAGTFGPLNVTAGGDYTVTPAYDEEHLNGVTTYDLVMISKHILGVDLLDSPYQIIAADANKSNSVTTFDLVEIRKLILFINTEFPNNTSWRFVDKAYAFANPANPFAANFPEVINYNNLAANQLASDFVAVKIGDVNRSASVNLTSTEDRTLVGDLVLNTDDVILTEGQLYTVEFKATDFAVSGYQFTMNFDNTALDFEGVVSGLATEANFGMTMVNEGVITTSWNNNEVTKLATDEVVFGLTFTAKQSGRLSNMLNVNSRYTVAEAYTAEAELLNVALSFNNTLVANGFELYQNTPNPFASTTAIGFYLPEATSATLTISDVQGKVVFVKEGDFTKGYNQVTLKRSNLTATGVLYYRLDTDNESATRKMILVD